MGTSRTLDFFLNNFVLNRYKTCAISVSNTGKQQFTGNQSIYQLSDKDYLSIYLSIYISIYLSIHSAAPSFRVLRAVALSVQELKERL